MKRLLQFSLLLLVFPLSSSAQRQNVHYAAEYPGSTVAAKVAAAQVDCNPLTSVPCIIIIDATLATATEGTLPAPCAQCFWKDYRLAGAERCASAASPILASCGGGGGAILKTPYVDLIRDCGAVGDGVADDTLAVTNCIANNPGQTLFARIGPNQSSSTGGGCTGLAGYSYNLATLAAPLTLNANGTALIGNHRNQWCGSPRFKIPAGVGGVLITDTCYSCTVFGIELDSQSIGAGSDVGIEARGGYPRIEGNVVNGFGSHGIWIDGQSNVHPTWQPDGWKVYDNLVNANRGDGILAQGTDANAGEAIGNHARANTGIGLHDLAAYPNLWMGNNSDANNIASQDENSIGSSWVTNYAEGNNTLPEVYKSGQGSLVVSGWHGKGIDTSQGSGATMIISAPGSVSGMTSQTITGLDLWNANDLQIPGSYSIRCGNAADRDCELIWRTRAQAAKWALRRAAADNTWKIWNYTTGAAAVSFDPTTSEQTWAPVAFASLGTPANGTFIYCNDCTIANPCAGGGTGAFAKRLNGVWVCN